MRITCHGRFAVQSGAPVLCATLAFALVLVSLSQAHAQWILAGTDQFGDSAIQDGSQGTPASVWNNAKNGLALGLGAVDGSQSQNGGNESAAIGYQAYTIGNGSVALGAHSTDGGQDNVISVGGAGLTRRIINVAPGIDANDAATVGQLQSAIGGIDSQANSYTDNAVSGILSQSEIYTNNAASGILSSAQTYANGVGSSTLSSANSYTDTSSAAALSAAKTYTDNSAASTLSAAQLYADGVGSSTLTSANAYADNVSATTLTSANSFATSYADEVGAVTLSAANAYSDTVGVTTLRSANAYTDDVGATTLAAANLHTDTRTQYFAANSTLAPAQASGPETLALGGGSVASGTSAIALGSNASALGAGSFAGGYGALAQGAGGLALGTNASVTADNSVALGAGSIAARGAQVNYTDAISGATTSSAGEVSVGSPGAERQITNVASGSAPTDAANVGQVQYAEAQAVNLSEAFTNMTANSLVTLLNSYGYNTSPSNGSNAVAVGIGASATGSNSTAIGSNSSAPANNSVALGAGSTASRGGQRNYKDPISGKTASSVGEVSIGRPGAERQITNVAPGSAPTDAANVGQVQAAISQAVAYSASLFGKASRQTWSVAAVSAALSSLPQAFEPGKSIIGIGMGTSHGEMGMAVGASYYMPDGSIIVKASASFSSEAGMTGGMGVGFVLN